MPAAVGGESEGCWADIDRAADDKVVGGERQVVAIGRRKSSRNRQRAPGEIPGVAQLSSASRGSEVSGKVADLHPTGKSCSVEEVIAQVVNVDDSIARNRCRGEIGMACMIP